MHPCTVYTLRKSANFSPFLDDFSHDLLSLSIFSLVFLCLTIIQKKKETQYWLISLAGIAQKKIDSSVQWNSDQYYTTWKLVLGTKIFPWNFFKTTKFICVTLSPTQNLLLRNFLGKYFRYICCPNPTGNRNLGKLVKFPYCYVIAKKIRYFKDFRKKN